MRRNKVHTAINILGLSIGIAACLLLYLVVEYEKGYDKDQPHFNSIYRVVTETKYSNGSQFNPGVPFPLIKSLKQDMPEIKIAPLITSFGSQFTVSEDGGSSAGNKKFLEDNGIFFSEPAWFSIMNYTFLSGNADVLKDPGTAILSRSIADKYFGDWKKAAGRVITMDNDLTLKIAAIMDDPAQHSDFPMRIIVSYETINGTGKYGFNESWGSISSNTQLFVRSEPGFSQHAINERLKTLQKKYYERSGNSSEQLHFVQPLSEMHFDTRFGNFGDHTISRATLWTLTLIGGFILLMACINFINLSTAQAVKRSKEIGIRKVMGSNRFQLFRQMMGETMIIVLISMALAILLSYFVLPYIKHIASINETLQLFSTTTAVFIPLLIIAVTLFAGIYPALILSGFNPITALKNRITSASIGGLSLRRGLVVTQFAISQVLVIGTIVAISQMSFVRNADLGFNKEAVFVMNANTDSVQQSRFTAFKQQLLQINGVESVSFSTDLPSSDNNWGNNFAYDHRPDEEFTLFLKLGDEDYLKTYGLQLLAGRMYAASDTLREVVVNETLIKKLGLKNAEEAVGKEIRLGRGAWRTITGVVKDFKTNSLREETKPILIGTYKRFYSYTSVKIKSQNLSKTKDAVLAVWDRIFPEYANRNYFADETINNFYRQENQLALLYKIFAGIAIFISCLGLYGLVSFMAVQRTKEVGIRKVLGASAQNIVYLFSKEFTILILIAFVIAAPLAWYLMNNWLENFAYKIKVGVGIFLIAIFISVVVAWLTVGYKALKASMANPVKSLRAE